VSQGQVLAGCDYLLTDPTSFFAVPGFGILNFQGVTTTTIPAGCGAGPTRPFDTVVRRLDNVTTNVGSTRLQMTLLQLVSTTPVFGGDPLYVTLNSPVSGLMDITGALSGGGTFNSTLQFFIDFQLGIGGPNVNTLVCGLFSLNCTGPNSSFGLTLFANGVAWSAVAPPLVGTDCAGLRFFIDGFLVDCHSTRGVTFDGQTFFPAPFFEANTTIPEPGTFLLLATGFLGLAGHRWRKSRR